MLGPLAAAVFAEHEESGIFEVWDVGPDRLRRQATAKLWLRVAARARQGQWRSHRHAFVQKILGLDLQRLEVFADHDNLLVAVCQMSVLEQLKDLGVNLAVIVQFVSHTVGMLAAPRRASGESLLVVCSLENFVGDLVQLQRAAAARGV